MCKRRLCSQEGKPVDRPVVAPKSPDLVCGVLPARNFRGMGKTQDGQKANRSSSLMPPKIHFSCMLEYHIMLSAFTGHVECRFCEGDPS